MIELVIFIGSYFIFFSENGYLTYLALTAEKESLKAQVFEMKQQKEMMQTNLGILKDDKKALEKFIRELLFLNENVRIIKFQETGFKSNKKELESTDKQRFQTTYIIITSMLLFISTIYFRRKAQKSTV